MKLIYSVRVRVCVCVQAHIKFVYGLVWYYAETKNMSRRICELLFVLRGVRNDLNRILGRRSVESFGIWIIIGGSVVEFWVNVFRRLLWRIAVLARKVGKTQYFLLEKLNFLKNPSTFHINFHQTEPSLTDTMQWLLLSLTLKHTFF